ncbi:hypothetical protein R1sor_019125 [Riccia sorocarpa]|uniref:Flavin-containing monooxygenase n=1 Tax=Riccia sorocarpa TaxID=122646 RepID=A0ABD3IBR2_9MARC
MAPQAQAAAAGNSVPKVLVIGAGAAGLVAALELSREGLDVTVYEQTEEVGGLWVYTPETESEPLGVDPQRRHVHSSMYRDLRTNLPREIMGYLDFPFLPKRGRDERRYPGCEEVKLYLKDFAEHYNLMRFIEFGVKVHYVGVKRGEANAYSENRDLKWIVRTSKVGANQVGEEIFDTVVICIGHFFQPRVISIPGAERWPGLHMHSHNYRIPEPFQDKVVVIIGNSKSGGDISKELIHVAKEVHICARNWPADNLSVSEAGPRKNTWHHPLVELACEDGTVKFQDGKSTKADVIMQCTGYLYDFQFLDTQGLISVEDGRVAPLYKHVFVPALAPSLSFVGLPSKILPFPLFQAQAKWIAKVLTGKVKLPSQSAMMADVEKYYLDLEAKGVPRHETLGLELETFEYVNWMLHECGERQMNSWRRDIFLTTTLSKLAYPFDYREVWDDQELLDIANASLLELSENLGIEGTQGSGMSYANHFSCIV